MKATFFRILVGIGGVSAAFGGVATESVAHAQTSVRIREPEATFRVRVAPPPIREEVRVGAPSPRHVWVGGYWNWTGNRHVWVGGRWALPPAEGRAWIAPRWLNEGGYWRFHPGYWGAGAVVEPAPMMQEGYTEVEPPPPQVEVVGVAPSPNHFWIGGHWAWQGGRHVWLGGHWELRRHGYNYAPGGWVREGHSWRWHEGAWRR